MGLEVWILHLFAPFTLISIHFFCISEIVANKIHQIKFRQFQNKSLTYIVWMGILFSYCENVVYLNKHINQMFILGLHSAPFKTNVSLMRHWTYRQYFAKLIYSTNKGKCVPALTIPITIKHLQYIYIFFFVLLAHSICLL